MVSFGIGRGDVVEVDTWVAASGKNGMRRDWHVRDCQTGQTIMRASRLWLFFSCRIDVYLAIFAIGCCFSSFFFIQLFFI